MYPQYIVMGMTEEQYWEASPYLASAYRQAYKLRRELDNEQAWLAGFYVYDAISIALANAFRKRGGKKYNYIEKPIDIFPLTEAEKKRREKEENAKMYRQLEGMARAQRAKKKVKDTGGG